MHITQHTALPGGVEVEHFSCDCNGVSVVPGAILRSRHARSDTPLLLLGHGGSGHKLDDLVLSIALPLVRAGDCNVLVIDGPVHGDRRPDGGADAVATLRDFDTAWRAGNLTAGTIVAEWLAVMAALRSAGQLPSRIGYYGLSMGTVFGMPLCAAAEGLCFAVLGMWSPRFVGSGFLRDMAPRVTAPLLWISRLDDPLFDQEGQKELFDAAGSVNRHFLSMPGPHAAPDSTALALIHAFVRHGFGQGAGPRA